jgi:hypothetical protein
MRPAGTQEMIDAIDVWLPAPMTHSDERLTIDASWRFERRIERNIPQDRHRWMLYQSNVKVVRQPQMRAAMKYFRQPALYTSKMFLQDHFFPARESRNRHAASIAFRF